MNEVDVERVARLARLKLSEKEKRVFARDFKEILAHFESLKRAKTRGVKPAFQPVQNRNVTREDKVEPSIPREKLLKNLKNKEEGYIKGPKVV